MSQVRHHFSTPLKAILPEKTRGGTPIINSHRLKAAEAGESTKIVDGKDSTYTQGNKNGITPPLPYLYLPKRCYRWDT